MKKGTALRATEYAEAVAAYLGGTAERWVWCENATAEAFASVACPGYPRAAVLWFKSIDQGRRAKGSEQRCYLIDEEPEDAGSASAKRGDEGL